MRRATRRQELRQLVAPIAWSLSRDVAPPVEVRSGRHVVLCAEVAGSEAAAAVALRYAAEVALWLRLARGRAAPEQRAAFGLLACVTASAYRADLTARERLEAAAVLPPWAEQALSPACHRPEVIAAVLGHQGLPPELAARVDRRAVSRLVARAAMLCGPAERLLSAGGDRRTAIDPDTGLSAYGCAMTPREDAISLSSCTASTISGRAYRRVEQTRQRAMRAAVRGDASASLQGMIEEVRSQIRATFGHPDTSVILARSGTHAETLASYLTLRCASRAVANVVVAPAETGSGVLLAAQGQPFADEAPPGHHGGARPAGLEGFPGERLELLTVDARDRHGRPLSDEEVNRRVRAVVEAAIQRGRHVLLHLLDCSKIGRRAPAPSVVAELRERHAEVMDVVVDACQMRSAPGRVREHLAGGAMVMVTGSKFLTGPAFSGALLVPPRVLRRLPAGFTVPPGLGGCTTQLDWPVELRSRCHALPARPNLGLLLRWQAALCEMAGFYPLPDEVKLRTLQHFARAFEHGLRTSPEFMLLPCPRAEPPREDAATWEGVPSILTFTVLLRAPDGQLWPMSVESAQKICGLLNQDLSALLPPTSSVAARETVRQVFQVGQPLAIECDGAAIGALRISAGARLVGEVARACRAGGKLEQIVRRKVGRALRVLEKIRLIVLHARPLARGPETARVCLDGPAAAPRGALATALEGRRQAS